MRLLLSLILLICTGSFSTCPHKEYFYYLEGTVGKKAIVMEIEQYEEVWFSKFYYKEERKDIFLKGSCDSTRCNFSTYRWDSVTRKHAVVETFTLSEQPDHNWHGERIDENKKVDPIFLSPVNKQKVRHLYGYQPSVKKLNPYSFLRTSDLRFKKMRSETFNGKFKVDWFRETISGIEFPRVSKGYSKVQQDSANTALEALHLKEVENYFSCSAIGIEGRYAVQTKFTYVGAEVIGFVKEVNFACQGRRLSTDINNLAIDVNKGKLLNLEDIFWMGKGTPPLAESQQWYEYRYNVFGARIKDMMLELYPEKMKNPQSPCNYNQVEPWQFPAWKLTAKGLYVGAFLPGIDRTCDSPEWAIIPYDKLKAYTNSSFHF